jgi:hypothetical protein
MKEKIVILSIIFSTIFFISFIGIYSNLISISYNPGDEFGVTLTIIDSEGGGGSDSEGGGPGGGGGGSVCVELWDCGSWDECVNVEDAFSFGILDEESYTFAKSLCVFEDYGEEICGYQVRNCEYLRNCNNVVLNNVEIPSSFQSCYFVEDPGCNDGITNCHNNSCEFGIDCGGPCDLCEFEKPTDKPFSLFSKILIVLGFKLPLTFEKLLLGGVVLSGLSMLLLIIYWLLWFYDVRMILKKRLYLKKK